MTHPLQITDPKAALEFMFGGSARFTLVSQKTGDRKTFRVQKKKGEPRLGDKPIYFAQLLTGPNNTEDYTYLGYSHGGGFSSGRKGNPSHPAFKALAWAYGKLARGEMPEQLEFWHEGRCARCARVLTDPESIERGLGPECAGKV